MTCLLPGRVLGVLRLLLLVLALGACGIKGPPKPPLEATAPDEAPDAGCCQERK